MTDKIKETEVLRKHIIGENGISYTLGEDGLYYSALYLELLLDGNLNEYLHQTDEECYQMMERLVEQMKAKQGVTEQLKSENQMQWVGMMNNIRHCAEEVVLRDIVYV